jgi:hypothetical protein
MRCEKTTKETPHGGRSDRRLPATTCWNHMFHGALEAKGNNVTVSSALRQYASSHLSKTMPRGNGVLEELVTVAVSWSLSLERQQRCYRSKAVTTGCGRRTGKLSKGVKTEWVSIVAACLVADSIQKSPRLQDTLSQEQLHASCHLVNRFMPGFHHFIVNQLVISLQRLIAASDFKHVHVMRYFYTLSMLQTGFVFRS